MIYVLINEPFMGLSFKKNQLPVFQSPSPYQASVLVNAISICKPTVRRPALAMTMPTLGADRSDGW